MEFDFKIGTKVLIHGENIGTIRFIGTTSFQTGRWIGIELDEPKGKNAGVVQGKRYFECRAQHGVFVRPTQVQLLNAGSPTSTATSQDEAANSGRSSASSLGASSRGSTPSRRTSTVLPSPIANKKRPTSLLNGNTPRASITVTAQQRRKSVSVRQQMQQQQASPPAPAPAPPLSPLPVTPNSPKPVTASPPPVDALKRLEDLKRRRLQQLQLAQQQEIVEPSDDDEADKQEYYEELRLKLKILESKRQEDRERFREYEKIKEEAEQFLTLRNKLQDKIGELQKDVRDTKRDLKEAMTDKDTFEAKYNDVLESLEMMTLDKEMAEERAESLQHEVDLLTEKMEEVTIDLDILRKESEILNKPPDVSGNDSKTPLEVIQLERHNERLKEALIKLRDATADKEAELNGRLKDMEHECLELQDIRGQRDRFKEQLDVTEYQMEDLKQRLDDAMGAEDLVEQLTDKNLTLTEQIEELRGTVDDLEALKELADELEENHVETEKQLEAEIEHRDMLLRDQLERLRHCEETNSDYEATIQQFRELVTLLQSDLEQLKQKGEVEASEKSNLSSQSQAMMSLNIQLQNTVMKSQAKSIDLELRKLEAAQATDRLTYVQPYLPDAFFKTENDPISCLLLFKRLVFKTDMIVKHLDQHHPISEKILEGISTHLVTICEMRQKAGWLSDLAKRFVTFVKNCKPDVFIKLNQVYHDVVGSERRLNSIVEHLRADEVEDGTSLLELQRMISQFEHLVDAFLVQYGESNHADQFFALTRSLDFNADRMVVEFTYLQQVVHNAVQTEDFQIEEGSVSLDVDYLEPLGRLIVSAKNCKITAKKLLRRLEELSEEALTLRSDHLHRFKTLYSISTKLCRYCYELCHQITGYVDSKRGSREPLSIRALQQLVRDKADEILDIPESTLWEASLKILRSLTTELKEQVHQPLFFFFCRKICGTDTLFLIVATGVAPWIQRASDMKAEVVVNHDMERKLQQSSDEIIKLIKDMKLKEQSLQEGSVKIDLLERRLEHAKKEAEQIAGLEQALEKAQQQEQMYVEAMDNLQAEHDVLDQELTHLKKEAAKKEEKRQSLLKKMTYDATATDASDMPTHSAAGSYQEMDGQIQTLKSTIRFLRAEVSQLRSEELCKSLQLETFPPVHHPSLPVKRDQWQQVVTQSRVLLKDIRVAGSSPKLVDLSLQTGAKWLTQTKRPAYQYQAQQSVLYTLQQRTQQLKSNMQSLAANQPSRPILINTTKKVRLYFFF
ncbi:hypothetical protein DM01DRAFT_255950 [Hesseltinella vesiculosa]|uniref:CAP-Gly domain-containing protein n=1 Tax=Hesseltinella vesiculosa TaxID=101127 RepID=A0A1X2G9B7_9FUNG|nr:hypothetical protein DM01DRAFT_255950 [Hesseltinella vesiculosa]